MSSQKNGSYALVIVSGSGQSQGLDHIQVSCFILTRREDEVIAGHQRSPASWEATAHIVQSHKRGADQNTTTEHHALVVSRHSKSPNPP